jgi:glycosyltransferase involved in cell wall biosynthesis
MKIFFIINSLAYAGPARQLGLLAAHLPGERFVVRVCSLGAETPWAAALRAAGIEVACLGWRRLFDVRPLVECRRGLRAFVPDLIHAWGWTALRAAAAVAPRRPPLLLSAPLRGVGKRLGLLERCLGRSLARKVLVTGAAEAEHCRRLGLPAERLVEAPLAVAPFTPSPRSREEAARALGLPAQARWIACVGPLDPVKGFRDALWAFDILRFVHPDLHLVVAGTGPDEPRLREFARTTRTTTQAHFAGAREDVRDLLAHAEVVWVPSRAERGLNVALEAMAAGRPVVATRCAALAEVVIDGVTGVLVPPGDQAALARETRLLVDDPVRRRRLGEAGRERAQEHFRIETAVQRYEAVYASLTERP